MKPENKVNSYLIKRLRNETNLNMKDFAEYYDIPYRTWQNWENETREMPLYLYLLLEKDIRHNIQKKYDYKILLETKREIDG